MFDRNAIWLPLAIMALLAVLSFWLERSIQEAAAPGKTNGQQPDSIIERFSATSTDETGVPRYRLTAGKLSHFTHSGATLLEQPRFTHLHARHGELVVSSAKASVSAKGEEVLFTGNTLLKRVEAQGREVLSLSSPSLKVLTEQEQIFTQQPVTITAPGLHLTAAGMHLSGKTRILKLKGRVKARFQNAPRR